uniref:Uncharacterized protein n=1 Tax=Aegilops tauschii TaxID=37682 RepID=M8C734_AEGTA
MAGPGAPVWAPGPEGTCHRRCAGVRRCRSERRECVLQELRRRPLMPLQDEEGVEGLRLKQKCPGAMRQAKGLLMSVWEVFSCMQDL